jgi:hypothetical protein
MIAIESFKKFRVKDFYVTGGLAGVYLLISGVLSWINLPILSTTLALFFYALLLSLVAYMVRKAGSATIFSLFSSLLSFNISNLDIFGIDKVMVFVLTGVVFEGVFLILKLEVKSIPLDIVLGSGVAFGIMPLIISFVVSSGILSGFVLNLMNMIILYFFIGILGGIIGFLIWYKLKVTKLILKYEYMV